jgi:hypothetical protein
MFVWDPWKVLGRWVRAIRYGRAGREVFVKIVSEESVPRSLISNTINIFVLDLSPTLLEHLVV